MAFFTQQDGGTHDLAAVDAFEELRDHPTASAWPVTGAGLYHLEIQSNELVIPEVLLVRILKKINSEGTKLNGPVYPIQAGEPDVNWPIPLIVGASAELYVEIQQVGGTKRDFVWELVKVNE